MVNRVNRLLVGVLALGLIAPPEAQGWGERGHDIVTRVAARLLAAKQGRGTPWATQLARKEFMLGHLSNVPDIVWRNQGEAIEKVNAPTHFLDLEYVAPELTFTAVPGTPKAALKRMKELCGQPKPGYVCPTKEGGQPDESSAGTAPFRVGQLFRLTVSSLRSMASIEGNPAVPADQALLTAGVMSHFVGDLGNPYHATRNYDGWETGQGGIHSYFETALVNNYPLSLDQQVYDAALSGKGLARVRDLLPAAKREALARDPEALAIALALDSYSKLDDANALDLKFARLKPSGVGAEGKRMSAERRPVSEVRPKFQALSVERLATAAELLAHLWLLAWEEAGKPDFKGYQSFAYPVSPEFIPPDYLTAARGK